MMTVPTSSRDGSEDLVPVLPGAEPFASDGGPIGIVLSHGFTGNPASMRPWSEHLVHAGFTVRAPRLPGHGTTWQELNHTRWQDWYGEIARTYDELAGRCNQVFAAGLSMGATLVTRLAEEQGDRISGLVLVNPSYGRPGLGTKVAHLVAPFVRTQAAIGSDIKKSGVVESSYDRTPIRAFVSLRELWKIVLADLGKVTAPILMYRSRVDHVVEPLSRELLLRGATTTAVREVILENSYHVATLDNDAQTIFNGSVDFIREHAHERVT